MSLTRPVRILHDWARNPHLPLRTVRMRLTLLYAALLLVSGAVLLAITYGLAWNATTPPAGPPNFGPDNSGNTVIVSKHEQAELAQQHASEVHQRAADMHQLLASSGIALLITVVLSIALGWLAAGRVLRPLRTMTAAAQRIGERNLHERLAVAGPDDELKRLGDTIDDLLARLEAAFDAQRRFVANASHELRTPLTMMRTALDVATRKPGPPAAGITILAGKIQAGLDRPTGWWKASLPSPAPNTAAPCAAARSRWTSSPPRSLPSTAPRSTACASPSARTITTRQCPATRRCSPT